MDAVTRRLRLGTRLRVPHRRGAGGGWSRPRGSMKQRPSASRARDGGRCWSAPCGRHEARPPIFGREVTSPGGTTEGRAETF